MFTGNVNLTKLNPYTEKDWQWPKVKASYWLLHQPYTIIHTDEYILNQDCVSEAQFQKQRNPLQAFIFSAKISMDYTNRKTKTYSLKKKKTK